MALSAIIRFTFDTDLQGFVIVPGSTDHATIAWLSSDGSPSNGCARMQSVTPNVSGVTHNGFSAGRAETAYDTWTNWFTGKLPANTSLINFIYMTCKSKLAAFSGFDNDEASGTFDACEIDVGCMPDTTGFPLWPNDQISYYYNSGTPFPAPQLVQAFMGQNGGGTFAWRTEPSVDYGDITVSHFYTYVDYGGGVGDPNWRLIATNVKFWFDWLVNNGNSRSGLNVDVTYDSRLDYVEVRVQHNGTPVLSGTANPGSADLTWTTGGVNIVGYDIWRSDDNFATHTVLVSGLSTLSYSDTTGVAGTEYKYRVIATDDIGGTGTSDIYLTFFGGFVIKRTIPFDILCCSLTLAMLVKVERRDGKIFGFTTTDIDVVYDGVIYEATSAVSPSAISAKIGSNVDNFDVFGLLQSDKITDADLMAGLYDSAQITIYICDFMNIAAGVCVYFRGFIGEVNVEDGKYTAEIRSLSQRLAQTVVEVTSKTCRVARLGDRRCAPGGFFQDGKTIADYQFSKTLASVSVDGYTLTFSSDAAATDYYTYGVCKFTTGKNIGIEREIKQHTLSGGNAVIVLQDVFPFIISVGDVATLTAGCDRIFATCVTKFANRYNFRGEPFIPSNQIISQRGRPPS